MDLEPVLRAAAARRVVEVVESAVHARESRPRPDLRLLDLLRELSGGRRLPEVPDRPAREARRRMRSTIQHELPERRPRHSDTADLDALAIALTRCQLITCDAFMADVIKRARLDLHHGCVLYTGRRADVLALRDRLIGMSG